MEISTIVNLVLIGILALFVISGFIWGCIRGLKKTTLRLGWLIVFGIALIFLSSVITAALLKMNVSFLHLKYNGDSCTTLNKYIELFVQDKASAYMSGANISDIVSLGVAFANMVANSIVFVLLFFVCKYLFLPIYWIIAKVCFGKRKQKTESLDEEGKKVVKVEKVKQPKHALWGGLVGVLVGLVICVFTMSPVIGYMSVLNKVDANTVGLRDENKGILSTSLGDTYTDIVSTYNNSAFNYIFKYTGLNAISGAIFSTTSKGNIGGENVYLTQEVDIYTKAVSGIYKLYNDSKNIKTMTQTELTSFVDLVKSTWTNLCSSKILRNGGDVLLPLGLNYVDSQNLSDGKTTELADSIDSALTEVKTYNMQKVQNTITSLINIVKIFDNHNLLQPLVSGSFQEDKVAYLQSIDATFAQEFMDELFNIDLVYNVSTELSNLLFTTLDKQLDFGYTKPDGLTDATVKTGITNIIVKAVDVISIYDKDSWCKVNTSQIGKIGAVLDVVKNCGLITQSSYVSLINTLEDKINTQIDSLSVSADMITTIKAAISDLSSVTNWTSEFTAIGDAIKAVESTITSDGKFSIDFDTLDFNKVGKAIDILQSRTTIFGNTEAVLNSLNQSKDVDRISQLVVQAIDWQMDQMGTYSSTFSSTITQLKDNIINQNANLNWEDSLEKSGSLFKTIKRVLDSSDDILTQFKNDTTGLFTDIGNALTTAGSSSLFKGNLDRTMFNDILTKVSTDMTGTGDIDVAVKNAMTTIKTNMNSVASSTTISWGLEFGYIQSLLKIDFSSVDLSNFTAPITVIDNIIYVTDSTQMSKLIKPNVINGILVEVMDSFLGGYTADSYATIITNMKNRIAVATTTNMPLKYCGELTKIKSLTDGIDSLSLGSIDTDIDNATAIAIGNLFDSVSSSYLIGDSGEVILNYVLTQYKTNQGSTTYDDLMDVLIENVNGIHSSTSTTKYNTAFTQIVSMKTIISELQDVTFDADTFSSFDTTSIETKLNTLQNLNVIVKATGARELAKVIMTKAKDELVSKRNEVTSNVNYESSTTLQNAATDLQTAIDYAQSYITYLGTSELASEPYTNGTLTLSGTTQINQPLTHLKSLVPTDFGE